MFFMKQLDKTPLRHSKTGVSVAEAKIFESSDKRKIIVATQLSMQFKGVKQKELGNLIRSQDDMTCVSP